MAYGIGQEIDELTELGVDELTRRQSVNPQLKYALALQEATNLVNAAAREREMAMEQPQPPQVIGQLEQGLAERLMPGVNQMVQQQQQPQQPQPMMEQGISGVPAPNMMMAGGGIVSFAEGGIPIGNNQPIPNLMDKYGSEMVTGFLEGEKQLREEAKYVAPEYADAYKQKRDNFYSHYPIEFIQELYETRKGSIGMEEEVSMAGGGTVSFAGPQGSFVGRNNPYNIRDYNQGWDGQTGATKGFVDFENEAAGVRAADKLLENYQSLHDISTVREVVARFAPPNENVTEEYIAFVSDRTGFTPDQPIDLGDPQTRNALLGAMGKIESGYDFDENILAQTDRARGPSEFQQSLIDATGTYADLLERERQANIPMMADMGDAPGSQGAMPPRPPSQPMTEEEIIQARQQVGLDPNYYTRRPEAAPQTVEDIAEYVRNVAREDAANEAQQADAEAEINLLNAATQTDDGRGIADQARRAAESARRTIAARETEDTGGIGGALRGLLGQTDAKSAALSVPEDETGIAAQARRAAESAKQTIAARETEDTGGIGGALRGLLGQTDAKSAALSVPEDETGIAAQARKAAESAKQTIAAREGTQDRSGYSIDGIKEALVNLLDLGPRERGAETFTDAAGNEYPTNPTALQKIQSIMDLPSAQEADAESPDTSGIGGAFRRLLGMPEAMAAGTSPSAEIEDTAATNERSIRDRILGAINPELASDYATVPTPSEQQNMQRGALQEERRALIDQQRQYSPFGDEKVIYDALQTKINGMTAQINAMQRRDIGGAQRIAEEEYEEQSNTNRILRELGLEEAIVELPNPYGTQVSETISDAPVDPVEEILTSSTNEVIDDGTSLVEETVTEELTPEAREFSTVFPGAQDAVDRYTIKTQSDPEPRVSQPQSAVSSVQDRYDQLTTPQSGSEAFFDLLKTLGGGGGRSEGYEFSGIAERGAENRAARSKEAMDIIDAENRLRAINAQNQTDQRTFIANYQQANAGKGTPAELYIEGAQLYLTARSMYSGNVSQTQEFYNIFENLKKDFQNPMNRAYQDAIREHGADSPQADAARANLFREATQILSAGVGAAEAAGV